MADYKTLLYEKQGQVLRLSLNRPEARNALNTELFKEMLVALEEANADPDVRVIVLTGTGPVFCAGQDLKFTSTLTTEGMAEYSGVNNATRQKLMTMDKPVVARVQGAAVGGGAYLITSCDIIVMNEATFLRMAEIRTGQCSGGAHLYTVGRQRSLEINLTGRDIYAPEADRWGMINKSVPLDKLDETVNEYVEMLIANPPIPLAHTKRVTMMMLELAGFNAGRGYLQALARYLHSTDDRKEAQQAFKEKRKPVFKGR